MSEYLPDRAATQAELVDAIAHYGLVSAAVGLSGTSTEIYDWWSSGRVQVTDERSPNEASLFDLASLTKPWMATLAVLLDQMGELTLDRRLGQVWQDVAEALAELELEDLLRHRGGFRAWAPLYHLCSSRDDIAAKLLDGALADQTEETYSDLGYLLWGLTVEKATQTKLPDLVSRNLAPLAGEGGLRPSPVAADQAVECLLDTTREVELAAEQSATIALQGAPKPGQVQDGNARFLEQLSGHAGLFGSAEALWRLGRIWLGGDGTLSEGHRRRALLGEERHVLGWARSEMADTSGLGLGPGSFGHVGFTGGSLWVDPGRNRIVVLLAHRASTSVDLAPWRRRFHELCLSD